MKKVLPLLSFLSVGLFVELKTIHGIDLENGYVK
jgi:hypothetical protein